MSETIDHAPADDGTVIIAGRAYMPDARGGFTPVELVKPQHALEDQTVRKVMGYARDLSAQIGRFKGHVFDDLGALDALLAERYGVKRGGTKGNRTYQTHDGLMKVQVAIADQIDFGPELQQAKALIDECLVEWTDEGRAEIRAIVLRAFKVEKEGQINKAELFALLRLEIEDERWKRAMEAIHDAIRITGSKQYFRFYQRAEPTGRWQPVTIDLAQA
ncbi:hypothetical protein [Microcystis phage Mwe-Yong1]|nr:hypothetical protein [Microcystis phage Mwe-Yong1]